MARTYSELARLNTFEERFAYLKLDGIIGETLFGYSRYLNQVFYQSSAWKKARQHAILRDNGLDLGVPGHEIFSRIMVHHIQPITKTDLLDHSPNLLSLDNLITVSFDTHNAITYGDPNILPRDLQIRTPFDTCPWKGGT